jgi:hypothetical protein
MADWLIRGEGPNPSPLRPMEWWQDVMSLYSSLKWYRSWPIVVPEGRAYVVDSLPRLGMSRCDYNTIEPEWPEDEPGFCLLEWDVALDIQSRTRFAMRAEETPERVVVAPYIKNYGGAVRQVHRRTGFESIEEGEPKTDFFGFGCIYLPQRVLREYLDTRPEKFTDVTFSRWYRNKYGRVSVIWDVRPQHLHGD